MGIKQKVEDHAVIFFLAITVAAFAAGWGAHAAIQAVSGLVSIPAVQLLDQSSYQGRIIALEAERDQLRKQILLNRPTGGTSLSNIALQPNSPAILKIGDRVMLDFDYVLPKGEKAGIWVHPTTDDLQFTFDGSNLLEGTGRIRRGFEVTSAGQLKEILIYVYSDNDKLYSMRIPVNYIFR